MEDASLQKHLAHLRALRQASRSEFRDMLVLIYGMACPLKCDFCCHPVEDYGKDKIPRDTAIDLINQAAELDDFKLIGFTGGEPFVYIKDITAIMEATCHHGIDVRIVTAAHWATSYERAIETLKPLVERGLTQLSVSTDPSHQQWVSRAQAEYAMQAGVDLGLVTEVACVVWDPDLTIDDFVTVPEGARRVIHLAAPVGRAAKREVNRELYDFKDPVKLMACGSAQRSFDVSVYPDGEVYPCCSGGFNRAAKLSFGNVYRDRLSDITERIHADTFSRIVIGHGLAALYEVARFKFPEIYAQLPDTSHIVSICQACVAVHRNEALMAKLEPVLSYTARVVDTLIELRGPEDPEHLTAAPPNA